jgi:hypothetical protein
VGQGDRQGIPLARNAGEWHARDHRGDRRGGEGQSRVLRLTLWAPDIVDSGRASAGVDDAGSADAAGGGVGRSETGLIS